MNTYPPPPDTETLLEDLRAALAPESTDWRKLKDLSHALQIAIKHKLAQINRAAIDASGRVITAEAS